MSETPDEPDEERDEPDVANEPEPDGWFFSAGAILGDVRVVEPDDAQTQS